MIDTALVNMLLMIAIFGSVYYLTREILGDMLDFVFMRD